MRFLAAAALFFTMTTALGACSTVDNISDCTAICDRYKSCYDASYDTSDCYKSCRSNSKSDGNFQDKVDSCRSCIDGKDCTAAAFNCSAECAGVVP